MYDDDDGGEESNGRNRDELEKKIVNLLCSSLRLRKEVPNVLHKIMFDKNETIQIKLHVEGKKCNATIFLRKLPN